MKLHAILMVGALLLGASAAQADVTFTADTTTTGGRPLGALQVGDTITIDVRISSTGTPAIAGVGASARDYDSAVVSFTSGNSVASFLHDVCIPGTGCFSGIDNQVAGALTENLSVPAQGPFVRFANGVSLTARTGTGDLDPGLDGIVGGDDAQFRLVFTAEAEGSTTIALGTRASEPIIGDAIVVAGGGVEDANNVVLNITVPEPSTAAIGMAGLGSVLALVGIRRSI
ncbi:MAG: PEP-CTERM sorting domain-containing protein [Myxococcota bacterium]